MRISGGHRLLSSSLAGKFPPLFGKSQCQEEGSGQECACLSAAPCTNRVGALYETILCPDITVLQMKTFSMMCVTVLGLSNKTFKKNSYMYVAKDF